MSESIDNLMRSGTSGQLDFALWAFWSKDGRAINLVPSTTMNDTVSIIVSYINQGARVTVHRGYASYIATEYGIVDLYSRTEQEKAKAMNNIAHPKFRENIEKGASAMIIISAEKAKELGFEPIARIKTVGCDAGHPSVMGISPVPALQNLLLNSGLKLSGFELIEVNGAFTAQHIGMEKE